jgi:membrane-associated phospholipid phosphatase
MRPFLTRSAILVAFTLGAATARADDAAQERVPTPIDSLGEHVASALTGTSLLWFGGAVAETAAMSASGGDHAMRVFVQEHLASTGYGKVAYYTGYILPAVVAPAIWIAGEITHDPELGGAGAAALQALGTTFVLTTALKVATGRPYPLNGGDPSAPDRLDHADYAQVWKPFSLSGRYSWPSGHVAGVTSIVAALTAYYPGRWVVPLVGYPVALAVGAGMLSGDRHWTSDVIAGALIAHAVGWSIGGSFRRERDAAHVVVLPMSGGAGVAIAGEL